MVAVDYTVPWVHLVVAVVAGILGWGILVEENVAGIGGCRQSYPGIHLGVDLGTARGSLAVDSDTPDSSSYPVAPFVAPGVDPAAYRGSSLDLGIVDFAGG